MLSNIEQLYKTEDLEGINPAFANGSIMPFNQRQIVINYLRSVITDSELTRESARRHKRNKLDKIPSRPPFTLIKHLLEDISTKTESTAGFEMMDAAYAVNCMYSRKYTVAIELITRDIEIQTQKAEAAGGIFAAIGYANRGLRALNALSVFYPDQVFSAKERLEGIKAKSLDNLF